MRLCPNCGSTLSPESAFCSKCGTKLQQHASNYCENPECMRCKNKYEFQSNDRFCDLCGKLTTVGKEIEEML